MYHWKKDRRSIDRCTVLVRCMQCLGQRNLRYGGGVLLAQCFLNIRLGVPRGDGRESGSRDLLLDSIDADAGYSYIVL